MAQTGTSPATPVPNEPQPRWGILEPREILGDTTHYVFNYEPGCNEPFWFDVDMEGGILVASTGSAFEVWNARNNGASPNYAADLCKPVLGLWKKSDTDFYAVHVAIAPAATAGALPAMAVVGLEGAMGVVAIDISTPSAPVVRYQDDDFSVLSLDATRINGRDYAVASRSTRDLALYDLTAAAALSECRDAVGIHTCGVFKRLLSYQGEPLGNSSRISLAGRFMAVRESTRTAVYDLAPALAGGDVRFVAEVGPRPQSTEIWLQGGGLYFATVDDGVTDVYEVPCAFNAGSCNPILRASLSTPGGLASNGTTVMVTDTVTHSEDAGVSYLYVGSTKIPGGGPQREYIFDITDLGNPTELTPQVHPEGYWGWYYEPNPTGFRHVAPRTAKVHNSYLYRSAYSILDVHEIVGNQPPVARIEAIQDPIYGGTNVQFRDASAGRPTSWFWELVDGGQVIATKTTQNPTFAIPDETPYPHAYSVRLQSCNDAGCSEVDAVENFQALDPAPSAVVTANVAATTPCGEVTFAATDVTGLGVPSKSWEVLNEQDVSQGVSGTTDTLVWGIASDQALGPYRGRLTLSNNFGTRSFTSPAVQVNALPSLTTPQLLSPVIDFGDVDFQVTADGATQWAWDFGDGTVIDMETDPTIGPNPHHEYTAVGSYTVRARVGNCRDGWSNWVSQPVVITEIVQLEIKVFHPTLSCPQQGCLVSGGDVVPFQTSVGGDPTLFEYDWNGDGTFEESSTTPVSTHVFPSPGTFTPKLRISRSGVEVEGESDRPIIVQGAAQPPSVSVSGPGSGLVDTEYTYSATAANCTASAWTWTTSGGSISGSSTGSSIRVSWASPGAKSVRAIASAGSCNNASGTRNTILTDGSSPPPPANGGDLEASFTISNATPETGETVTFDASASAGGPASYSWTFGDGKQASSQEPVVTHVYEKAGSYSVTLSIGKPSSACNFGFCSDELTKQITVAGDTIDPPPPPGVDYDGTCEPDAETLCLKNRRFEVKLDWVQLNSEVATAKVVPEVGNEDSGLFYFLNPNNWEVLIKIVNGCSFNERFWVFGASSTDRGLILTVTDTKAEEVVEYRTQPGKPAPATTDNEAFATCNVGEEEDDEEQDGP